VKRTISIDEVLRRRRGRSFDDNDGEQPLKVAPTILKT